MNSSVAPSGSRSGFSTLATRILLAIVLASMFFGLTMPISDPDFWWHLATGRWVWENRELMHSDPFTFTGDGGEDSARRDLIFTQYWLAQLFSYAVYLAGGFTGLVTLRASVFTLMFLFLYLLIRRSGGGFILGIVLLYLAFMAVVRELYYVGDRPQMWSSLFSVVTVFLLQEMKDRKKWASLALPPLMLLWSNMHGGFVFGLALIAIYVLEALVLRTGTRGFYVSALAAAALSACNPNGLGGIQLILSLHFGSSVEREYQTAIVESQSIFAHARPLAIPEVMPHLTALVGVSLVSMALNARTLFRKRQDLLVTYLLVLAMGIVAIRYLIFFIAVSSFFTAVNLRDFSLRHSTWSWRSVSPLNRHRAALAVALVVAIFASARFALAQARFSALLGAPAYVSEYEGAVRFLRETGLRGRMFNDYTPGGYLVWSLTPDIKVFIDGRAISLTAFREFRRVVTTPYAPAAQAGPDRFRMTYQKVLDDYGVRIVSMPGCDSLTGTLIPLSVALARDPVWVVVYSDDYTLIFLRDIPENSSLIAAYGLPPSAVYDNVIALAHAASRTEHGQMIPSWRYSLAFAYNEKGDREAALFYLNEYLTFAPGDTDALQIRNRLKRELAGQDKTK